MKKSTIGVVAVATSLTMALSSCNRASTSGDSSTSSSTSSSSSTTSAGSDSTASDQTAPASSGSTTTAAGSDSTNPAGSSIGTGKAITIGVVPKTLQNPVWQGVIKGAETQAKTKGNITIKASAPNSEEDITGQINKIQDLITQKVDALVVAPDGDSLQPILQQAVDKGIPVVLIDTDIKGFTAKTAYVSSDQAGGAKAVTDAAVKALGPNVKGAEVGLLDFPGNTTVQARVDAAKQVYEAAGAKIVSELPGKCDRATALNSTTDMLTAHPNIKAIFGGCGQGATGAALAVGNAKKTVLVTGFDGINGEFKDIQDGTMLATILQDFPKIGAQSVDIAVAALNKQTVNKIDQIPGIVITKDNVGKYQPAG